MKKCANSVTGVDCTWPQIADELDANVAGRITERRTRILQRQQEAKGVLPEIESSVCTDPPRRSQEQVAKSDTRLAKISSDTGILVGNVRTASLAYDAERRFLTQEAKDRRQEVLERESKVGADHFKDITNKWMDTIKIKVPSELHQHLVKQKNACDAVIQEKDKLIASLKQEIEGRRLNYDDGLDRQEDEMEMAVCRAREQVQLLSQCYTDELAKINAASVAEWKQLVEKQQEEWDEALRQMKSNNVDRLERTRQACDKWESQLDELSAKKAQEYRSIQTELERDIERLEQNLQSLKSALQLNEEKLDYGCQVFRKREEEQLKVKANQKRRMAKLNDVAAALRSSLLKLEMDNRGNLRHVDHDCKRIQKQILNHEKKFKHLEITDGAKLDELWRLNDETVRNLVGDLLQIDREICENILQLPWQPPALSFSTSFATCGTSSATTTPSVRRVRCTTIFRMGILATRGRLLKSKQSPDGVSDGDRERDAPPAVRREILRVLANKANFLIEKSLHDMIETFPQDEQILMQLDAIFTALSIKNEAEVEMLIKYIYENFYRRQNDDDDDGVSLKLPPLDVPQVDSETILTAVSDFIQKRQSRSSMRKALRNVQKLKEGNSKKSDLDWKCSDYWSQFALILPESREMVWKALSIGLQKLRQAKMEHCMLLDEVVKLQTQNNELNFLLSEYTNSRDQFGN